MTSSIRDGESRRIPLDDFESELRPFELPGGPALQNLISHSRNFVLFGKSEDGTNLWLSRRGALDGLFTANLRAAASGAISFSPSEFCRRAGWPDVEVHADAFSRLRDWWKGSSLVCHSADRRTFVLVLGAFIADLKANVRDQGFAEFFTNRCAELSHSSELPPHTSLIESAIEGLQKFDGRAGEIISLRSGLTRTKPMTLEAVGKKMGITRERVRQIESRARKSYPWKRSCAELLANDFFLHNGRRTAEEGSTRVRLWRLAEFLLEAPISVIGKPKLCILGIEPRRLDAIGWKRWSYDELFLGGARRKLDTAGLGLAEDDLTAIADSLSHLRKESMQKGGQIICALEHIGHSAHYSDISVVRAELFPGKSISDRNVHAALGFLDDAAYAGRRGVYGLKRWGVSAPSQHLDKQVIEALQKLYRIIGAPIPFKTVLSQVRRERPEADATSVQMILSLNAEKMPDHKWKPRYSTQKKASANGPAVQTSRFFRPRR